MIIGLTGGIGSGKSIVTGIFAELGAYTIDADAIARSILNQGEAAYKETVSYFGNEILNPDGSIDRKRLASIVFNNKQQLEMLNSITHKYIFKKMQEMIDGCCSKIIILDVPLLFSSEFPIHYDLAVVVSADSEIRIKRVMSRDNADREQVIVRMKNQLSDIEMKDRADYIIENNTDDITALREKVKELYRELIQKI